MTHVTHHLLFCTSRQKKTRKDGNARMATAMPEPAADMGDKESEAQFWYREGYEAGVAAQKARLTLVADELRMLPQSFVDAYGALWGASLRHPQGTLGPDERDMVVAPRVKRARTSTGQTETRGVAKAEKRRGRSVDPVLSLRYLREKARIDRKLRKITREIEAVLSGGRGLTVVKRCPKCQRFGDEEWVFCPREGAMLMVVEEEK
jgi:hypothetical protein